MGPDGAARPSLAGLVAEAGAEPRPGQALEARLAELEARVAELSALVPERRATLVVFSNDLDKALAAFVIATGAATAGLETSMFFTFWGLSLLRRDDAPRVARRPVARLLDALLPGGPAELGVSKLNYFGAGALMLRRMMKDRGIVSLEELMALAPELGIRRIACTMSMDALGIAREELVDGLDYGGVATYMADAARSRVNLFV